MLRADVSEQFRLHEVSCSPKEKGELLDLLVEYQDVISRGPSDIGQTDIIEHEIIVDTQQPIRLFLIE